MASSFINQVPTVIHLVQQLRPARVLDIGKGFGKYAFLSHEYAGIDNSKKLDPGKSMAEQSTLLIDAVEVDPDLMLPHLSQLYNKVYFGDILQLYPELPDYDLVLMIDVIEHIDKAGGLRLLRCLLQKGMTIIIATPKLYFEQHLYESEYEHHVSHWTVKDFHELGFVSTQYFDAGAIFLLSGKKMDIRGFGNSWIKKIRRISRAILNEF